MVVKCKTECSPKAANTMNNDLLKASKSSKQPRTNKQKSNPLIGKANTETVQSFSSVPS